VRCIVVAAAAAAVAGRQLITSTSTASSSSSSSQQSSASASTTDQRPAAGSSSSWQSAVNGCDRSTQDQSADQTSHAAAASTLTQNAAELNGLPADGMSVDAVCIGK